MRAKPYRVKRVDDAVAVAAGRCGTHAESLLPILQVVQAERGHLDSNAIGAASDALNLPDAHTFGVASFYSMLSTRPRSMDVVRVCDGPVCMACGGSAVSEAIEAARQDGWTVERTSCLGQCDRAPAALSNELPCGPLTAENASALFSVCVGDPPTYADPLPGEQRIKLARVGKVDPGSIDSAIDQGAYQVLSTSLQRSPGAVLQEVETSGLRGCGGAGFPSGRKMRFVAEAAGRDKCVICNADESEPTAFKDRVLMEGDPHLLLEGMALAGFAVGAEKGIIYIRGEYEQAARLMERAIAQATDRGQLGANIQGGEFSFGIQVHRGAGAYICGEETALLESLEGRRGEPRIRPPYPTTRGYRGQPTLVNNVETLCALPFIVQQGGAWYGSFGTDDGAGTKLFTITGHVQRPGLMEVPFGITLRQIIDDFGGGMRAGSEFKMALAGGAAGTIVGADALDIPLDFAATEYGVTIGSGGFLVLDQSVSVITLLGWLLHFFEVESCGKCTPCREGTREARMVLERFAAGTASRAHRDELKRLTKMLELTSLCGLGQSAAWPIESALENFADEFRAVVL